MGLFIVPVGELERFIPAVGGKGPGWLTAVYESGLHRDTAATGEARRFVGRVAASI